MARDMGAWRRVVLFIGFSTAGLTLLSVAVTTFLYGTGFMATGPRRWLFREFAVIQIESPVAQIISGVCLAIAGGGFMWLAYKTLRHPNKATLPNEQPSNRVPSK
jgi:hypothetical protein